MRTVFSVVLAMSLAGAARAEVVTETVEYEHEGVKLRGFLAYDNVHAGPLPGVLVVPEWWGLNDYAKARARQLAALGYVAMAADMYGQGQVTNDAAQAQAWSRQLYGQPIMRTRAAAGLATLAAHPRVDPRRLGAIGYCFGGTAVLELAYSGAPLRAVVPFHGRLTTPKPEDDANIGAKILVCTGADDTAVNDEEVAAFHAAMRRAGVDYLLVSYGHAVHSFTNPAADGSLSPNVKYNEPADRRSWEHMRQFLAQELGQP